MVLTVERHRGNAVLVNGHTIINGGAYATETPSVPEDSVILHQDAGADLPYACEPGSHLTDEQTDVVLAIRASAALRAAKIIDARAWEQYRAGDTSASSALWAAAAIIDREFEKQASAGGQPADADIQFIRAGIALRAAHIIDARGWEQQRVGNLSAATAYWEAASIIERAFTADVAQSTDRLVKDLWS